jgi:hypothetical protein
MERSDGVIHKCCDVRVKKSRRVEEFGNRCEH